MGRLPNAVAKRPDTSSRRDRCTMRRRRLVHRWPAVPAAEKVTPRTTNSMSALGAMMAALLPPSSRMLRPNRSATTGATLRPMAVLPVALTMGTPACATSSAPTLPSPSITWFRSAGTSIVAAAFRTVHASRARSAA
jgi:hypothetical protein